MEQRYELSRRLGEGAAGVVYLARDRVLGIPVAVKMLRVEFCRVPEIAGMFEQEASLSARMLSPHVVKVLGRTTSRAGVPCIVYELLEGESVAARLERSPRLSLEETGAIVQQAARGLSRAHALGVLHRDVKPDNLFLATQEGARPVVKLLDFGVAEQLATPGGAATRELVGTVAYMAPEVLFGPGRPDARTDLYALGVVAYECLTGACPCPPDGYDELFEHLTQGRRLPVRHARPELPEAVDDWMDRALHPDPFWRFASAREMAEAMERVLSAASRPRPRTPRRRITALRLAA
jgi:serine/threonine-protein kinase